MRTARNEVPACRRGAVLVLLTVSCLALAGCSSPEDGQPARRVTVTFWQFWDPEIIQPLAERFEFEHPDIRVEVVQIPWQGGLEQLEAALAAGRPPDLCELSSTWLPRLVAAGRLRDLTALVQPLTDGYLLWAAVTLEQRVFALPWLAGTRALYINRTLFRRAGLDADHPPTTWDGLLAAATRIDSLDSEIHGFGIVAGEPYLLHKQFLPFAWGNGGQLLAADGRHAALDAPAMRAALVYFVELARHALRAGHDELVRALREDRLGMLIDGAWSLERIATEAPDCDLAIALVPRPQPYAGVHASFADLEVLAVPARAAQRTAAVDLARFLLRSDNAVRLCRMAASVQPAARGALADPYYASRPLERVFVEQLATASAPPPHPRWIAIQDILDAALAAALDSLEAPGDALARAAGRVDRLLAGASGRP